ncbi:MAG: hypothetical protein H6742_05780 [Alphaproteobacteria bacterium]|nr:hypothetical protein [Alphaproteobacteria bacterium]
MSHLPPIARGTALAVLGLLGAGPAFAADLVLTDFTPATMGDFAVAEDLTNLARLALLDQGLDVMSAEDLEQQVGGDADGCADEPACPENLWSRVDADQALVGRVEGEGGSRLRIQLQLWRQGRGVVRRWDRSVPSTAAGELLLEVAAEIAPDAPPPPAVAEVRPGVVDERYEPLEPEEPLDDPEPLDEPRKSRVRGDVQDLEGLGLPRYAERRYVDSGLSRDEWLERARVRTGAVFLELHGGALFGDLDRRYDVRMALYDEVGDDFSERGQYRYESFLNSRGFVGGAAIGYQVAWWIDASVLGGVQLGRKELTTGWETFEAAGNPDGSDRFLDDEETIYDPVSAVIAMMEPRFRLYPVATGPVKPYALVGFHMRFYDAYTVPDGEIVTYPEAGGGVSMGPTVGGGLAFDAPKGAVGFLEVPWTYIVVPGAPQIRDDGVLETTPAQFAGVGQFVMFKAGVAIHFR